MHTISHCEEVQASQTQDDNLGISQNNVSNGEGCGIPLLFPTGQELGVRLPFLPSTTTEPRDISPRCKACTQGSSYMKIAYE